MPSSTVICVVPSVATSNANSVPSTPATTFWFSTENSSAYPSEYLAEQDVQGSDAHARRAIDVNVADRVTPHANDIARHFHLVTPLQDLRNGRAHADPIAKQGHRIGEIVAIHADVARRICRIGSCHHDEPGSTLLAELGWRRLSGSEPRVAEQEQEQKPAIPRKRRASVVFSWRSLLGRLGERLPLQAGEPRVRSREGRDVVQRVEQDTERNVARNTRGRIPDEQEPSASPR